MVAREFAQGNALARQMGAHSGFSPFGIAGLECGKHRHVLGETLLQTTWRVQLLQPREFDELAQVTDHLPQPAVVGQGDDGFVDREIDIVVVVDPARLSMAPEPLVQLMECIQVSVGRIVGGFIRATTAIFYSISNTQPGLRGVSFGDSLIKQVVETLHREFPRLKTFATLSPIPGLRAWLIKHTSAELLQAWEQAIDLPDSAPVRRALLGWAARYLGVELQGGKPLDPVARFHLGNGACVARLNWAADPSTKGLKQSYGLMVNYLYDLKRLDKHRAMLAQAKIPTAQAIKDLYL